MFLCIWVFACRVKRSKRAKVKGLEDRKLATPEDLGEKAP